MTGKHYNWHKRWRVDREASTLTHDSGLILRAHPARDSPGAVDLLPENLDAWQLAQRERMPLPDIVKHARRLMQEGAELWQRNA